MNDSPAFDPPTALRWPDGLDERAFLARHWQREPLLLRQALPGFESPLTPDELAGLALEPDTTPRLIERDAQGHFNLEHGPFEASRFETLGERDWSLLVTDVEKHLPDLAAWIAPLRLAPDWRFDDLMISYAPDGASVGAHVDEYDVFLLQASGTRRWSIERSPRESSSTAFAPIATHRTIAGGDLRLLADFEPTDTWDLAPGDVLYLPPGVPHHGVAVGENCMTWSIGFRSPSAAETFLHMAELVAERLPHTRLRDGGRGRGDPGRVEAETVEAIASLWRAVTTLDRDTLIELSGRLLTRSGTAEPLPAEATPSAPTPTDAARHAPDARDGYRVAPFTRLAWSAEERGSRASRDARLFVDGECLWCSCDFARRLCDTDTHPFHPPERDEATGRGDARDEEALFTLLERGALLLACEENASI